MNHYTLRTMMVLVDMQLVTCGLYLVTWTLY